MKYISLSHSAAAFTVFFDHSGKLVDLRKQRHQTFKDEAQTALFKSPARTAQ